ncbi:folate-sensitive fragile site protein Fra10Ac1-domain-containing protein [Lyophyllum atratum]|nr:folate-sensitive fragile site protein Fra10Ac1-domain-containing protein [Lyophyllum atratum]
MMALYHHGSASKAIPPRGVTEFEILKAAHRFLRDEDDPKGLSWEEQLASKYYASLYREYAVCDLKHYKTGNLALRWRTDNEVLSGAGETTCGNTRCEHHHPLPDHLPQRSSAPTLTTLELPFTYVERGENKSALVKVVLCPRCFDKLMWKRRKERGKGVDLVEEAEESAGPGARAGARTPKERKGKDGVELEVKTEDADVGLPDRSHNEKQRGSKQRGKRGEEGERRRRRSSRSLSPRTSHRPNSSRGRQGHRSEREHGRRRSP